MLLWRHACSAGSAFWNIPYVLHQTQCESSITFAASYLKLPTTSLGNRYDSGTVLRVAESVCVCCPWRMPSANPKLEKQASTETTEPIRQAIIVIEHKIRNLEKRKVRLSRRVLQSLAKINLSTVTTFYLRAPCDPPWFMPCARTFRNFLWDVGEPSKLFGQFIRY